MSELEEKVTALREEVAAIELRIQQLDDLYADVALQFQTVGEQAKEEARGYLSKVRDASDEAEKTVALIKGGALFGRYSGDADHHMRVANQWRRLSVVVLLVTIAVVAAIALTAGEAISTLIACSAPGIALFLFCSLESQNHRRREFDRRRISLRMAAIESYMQQKREAGADKEAWDLLDEFIREHFIQPTLDSNDMSYLAPNGGPWRVFGRDRK